MLLGGKYYCTVCDIDCETNERWKFHFEKPRHTEKEMLALRNEANPSLASQICTSPYCCPFCSTRTSTIILLRNHLRNEHKNHKLTEELERHIQNHANNIRNYKSTLDQQQTQPLTEQLTSQVPAKIEQIEHETCDSTVAKVETKSSQKPSRKLKGK